MEVQLYGSSPEPTPNLSATSGSFESDTGTGLNIVVDWTLTPKSDGSATLSMKVSTESYSLYNNAAWHALSVQIGGQTWEFDTEAIEYAGPGLDTNELSTAQIELSSNDPLLVADMHKAIAVILFKLEGQLVSRNPNFNMSDRRLLDKIDFENATVTVGEKKYPISDTFFPTVDHDYPYELTKTEKRVMEQLKNAFMASEKLKRHIDFLFAKGGMYKCCNNNLLLHGCIPMNKDGSFMEFDTGSCVLSGKALLDELEKIVRQGHSAPENSPERQKGNDYMWYLWCGKHSPLFGREKMCSFERFFIDDSETHTETRNHYYTLYHDEDACVRILKEFGLSENHGHIINGHVPVISKKGESPINANGKLIVIDGGFCRAYQDKTGTAGYTLVYNSYGMRIVTHEPFAGIDNAIKSNKDILSTTKVFDTSENRIRVAQTDDGQTIRNRIEGLSMLLCAYRNGVLKEQ